jgi:hypothetical protein
VADSAEKLRLEIRKLRQETSRWTRISSVFWPIAASLFTAVLGYATWRGTQLETRRENVQKEREFMSSALKDATDSHSGIVRQIAGLWQVNAFWTEADQDTQDVIAATLAGILGSSADPQIRCVAAEVIGNAITEPDGFVGHSGSERAAHLAHILYGHRRGTIGVVVFQNLQAKAKFASSPTEHCYGDTDATPLDATKEAIRKNWEYLREVNLANTDLEDTWLYSADLDGALLANARLARIDLRCANLAHTDFSGSDLTGADFFLAHLDHTAPEALTNALPVSKLFNGTEEEWNKWRDNNFRVNKKSNLPVLKQSDNLKDDVFPCFDLRLNRPNQLSPIPTFNEAEQTP